MHCVFSLSDATSCDKFASASLTLAYAMSTKISYVGSWGSIIIITVVSNECGGVLMDFVGQFSSPDNDNDGQYDINLHCHWTIEVDDGHMIQLTILDIDIEKDKRCRYDFIKVVLYKFHLD